MVLKSRQDSKVFPLQSWPQSRKCPDSQLRRLYAQLIATEIMRFLLRKLPYGVEVSKVKEFSDFVDILNDN